ncbi:MAG: hypothetical protein ACFCGT_10160, partial [Sandaracinaceae bacterium]
MGRARTMLAGAGCSLGLHLAAALVLVQLPEVPPPPAPELALPFEAVGGPGVAAGGPSPDDAPSRPSPPVPGGPVSVQNIDAPDRGAGGDRTGAARAMLLMDRAEGVLLFDSPLNNLRAGQSQRIRTARTRASVERRRATPNPADEAFLASGAGRHPERRPVARADARPGARAAPEAGVEGRGPVTA